MKKTELLAKFDTMLNTSVPNSIRRELSIYLAANEKILKAVSSTSGRVEAVGQVWLILTNLSVFFFTRKHGKEPVIALLERRQIKKIESLETPTDIILTFVPKHNDNASTRISFPITKKNEIEDFCEDLIEFVIFKNEPQTPTNETQPAASIKKQTYEPQPTETKPSKVKYIEKTAEPPKQEPLSKSMLDSTPSIKDLSSNLNNPQEDLKPGKVGIITLISVAVAFLWYQLFKVATKN